MALVLVGFSSYGVIVVDEAGVERRVQIRRGQDISGLNIPEAHLKQLKAMTVRGAGRRISPAFIEMASQFDAERHTEGGRIKTPARAEEPKVEEVVVEEPKVEEPKVEEVVVEEPKVEEPEAVVEEVVVEEPKVEEPEAKKAPAKKAKKKTKK